MAIAFGDIGAKAEGQATLVIPYPASVGAGDLLLAGRCLWRPSTITATDETGWTPLGDLFGGTGTATDDHTTRIRGDYQLAAGSETGTVTFDTSASDGSTTDGAIGVMARYTKGAGTWDAAAETGDDATHGNTRDVTLTSAHTVEAGDWLVALVAVDRDPALTIIGAAFTGTATFGTITERASGVGGSSLGRDGNIAWFDVEVTGSGTCTGFTMTTETVVQCGPVDIIRLREVGGGSVPSEGSASGSWSFTGTASGKRSPIAAGWGGFEFTGSATGARTPKGSASGGLSWAGSATGQRSPKGSGSGSYAYSGTATGTAPGVDSAMGGATGSWAYTGTSAGKRSPVGTSTGTLTITGAATGIATRDGSAVGTWAYVGTASGLSSDLVAPPSRTLSVVGEARILSVAGESRVLTIPTDHRTLEA